MANNYTQLLLAAKGKGAVIVVLAESTMYAREVTYDPRHANDPKPWMDGLGYRFSGKHCHVKRSES